MDIYGLVQRLTIWAAVLAVIALAWAVVESVRPDCWQRDSLGRVSGYNERLQGC